MSCVTRHLFLQAIFVYCTAGYYRLWFEVVVVWTIFRWYTMGLKFKQLAIFCCHEPTRYSACLFDCSRASNSWPIYKLCGSSLSRYHDNGSFDSTFCYTTCYCFRSDQDDQHCISFGQPLPVHCIFSSLLVTFCPRATKLTNDNLKIFLELKWMEI